MLRLRLLRLATKTRPYWRQNRVCRSRADADGLDWRWLHPLRKTNSQQSAAGHRPGWQGRKRLTESSEMAARVGDDSADWPSLTGSTQFRLVDYVSPRSCRRCI